MKKFDVISLGEILIDWTPFASEQKMTYQANPGGAPANAASAAAKLGAKVSFVGKVGNDAFGKCCKKALEDCGVNTSFIPLDSEHHTSFAFVSLNENGERSFTFCRDDGADVFLSKEEIPAEEISNARIFHLGSLSLVCNPAEEATRTALEIAKKNNVAVSYDPNWRGALWKNKEEGIRKSSELFKYADMIKISDEEMKLYFGENATLEDTGKKLVDSGARLVCITLGKDGVYYATKDFCGKVKVPEGNFKVADTTGAGDSFTGALLYRMTRRSSMFDFTKKELESDLFFANTAASICVTRKGAIPALASLDEINNVINKNSHL